MRSREKIRKGCKDMGLELKAYEKDGRIYQEIKYSFPREDVENRDNFTHPDLDFTFSTHKRGIFELISVPARILKNKFARSFTKEEVKYWIIEDEGFL